MTQTEAILALLRERPQGLTAIDALSAVGSFRLAARIADLRAEGHNIESEWMTTATGKRIVRYILVQKPVQLAAGF